MQRPRWSTKFCVFVSIAVLCAAQARAQGLPVPYRWTYSFEQESRSFRFPNANVDLTIPISYIYLPNRFRKGRVFSVPSLSLLALLPGIEGRSRKNDAEFRKTISEDRIWILLQDQLDSGAWKLSKVTHAHLLGTSKLELESSGQKFGLYAQRQAAPENGNWHWKYILKDRPLGEPNITIRCDGEGTVPLSHCQQFFIYQAMLVTVTYRMESLSNWEEIQGSVSRRLNQWK